MVAHDDQHALVPRNRPSPNKVQIGEAMGDEMLTRLHMKIHTNSRDENSVLVMNDGYLVAILVKLDDDVHGSAKGRWHLEAHFDHVPATGRLFEDLDEAVAWVETQTESPDARHGFGTG